MLFHGCHASYLLYSVYTDKYLCCSLQKAMAVLCVFGGDLTLCKQVTGWKARPATAGDVLSELQSPSWRAPLPQGTPPPACLPTGALGQEPQVVLRMGPTPPQGPPPGTLPVGASAWAGRQSCSWPGGHAGWPWRASLGPVLSAPRIEGRTDTRRAACLSGTAAGLAGHLPWELGGGGEGALLTGQASQVEWKCSVLAAFLEEPCGVTSGQETRDGPRPGLSHCPGPAGSGEEPHCREGVGAGPPPAGAQGPVLEGSHLVQKFPVICLLRGHPARGTEAVPAARGLAPEVRSP